MKHIHHSVFSIQRLLIAVIALAVIGAPLLYLSILNSKTVKAAWFDDNWAYRKAVNIATHNTSENNVYINLTGSDDIDTSDTARFQTDCGDLRFTDASGNLLKYYVVSGCSSTDTVVHVLFNTMPAGAQTIYYYYGNPTIANGGNAADFATEASSYTFTTIGSEETTPGPITYWKFDDGTGTTAQDATSNNNDGTISGATWQTEDQCVAGKCLYFDGSNDVVTVSNTVSGIQTVSLWIKPITTSEQIIDINGTASISVSSGTISATSFTSPTIYVNGKVSSTLTANIWQYVTVTTSTALSGSAIKIGQISTNYGQAFIDDVKLYPYARSAAQVLTDYNSRGSVKGSSVNLGSNNQNLPPVLTQGLVGYWKFDENTSSSVKDSSGNPNTGTWNGTGSTHWATGKYESSGNFNGADDYVDVGNGASFNVGNNLTISAWIKATSLAARAPIFSTRSTNAAGSFQLEVGPTNSIANSIAVTTPGAWNGIAPANTLTTNTWYHIVFTKDGTGAGNKKIYVNGISQTLTQDSNVTFIDNDDAKVIGQGTLGGQYFPGQMDDIRIYNRALSSSEVATLYNAPPVGYWNMDDASGTSAQDSSGNGNTGTLTAGPTWAQGKYGAGINFDGTNDYVDMGSPSTLDNIPVKTVEFWTKLDAQQCGTCAGSHWINKGDSSWFIATDPNNSRNIYGHNFDGTSGRWSFPQFSLNTWHYVVVAYDRTSVSNDPTIYVDGVPQTVTEYSTPVGTTTDDSSDSFLVSKSPGNTRWVDGQIDEVKIYNYTRTQKQIVEDMNAGHPAVGGAPVGAPLGNWDFDEGFGTTANNSGNQGSTLNGSMSGFASPATSTSGWTQSGKFGKALLFDGTNDYVNMGSSIAPTSTITMSGWINTNVNNTVKVIVAKRVANDNWQLFLDSTGKIGTTIYNTSNAVICNFLGSTTINTGTWYHVASTYDGSNCYIYVNGIQDGTASGTGSIGTNGTNTYIGIENTSSTTRFWNGSIDEVKIYNYALTADEVKIDMNRGQAQVLGTLSDKSTYQPQAANQEYCVPGDTATSCAPPVGEWSLEQTTGSTVRDTSGNGFNGTFVGTSNPAWTTGKYGGALKFTSASSAQDDVEVPDNASLSFTSNQITISAWVNPTTTTSLTAAAGKYKCGVSYEEYVIGISSGKAIMRVANVSGTNVDAVGATTLSANTWYHLSGSYNGTIAKVYVNGILDGSTSSAISMQDTGASFTIGALDSDETNPACSNRYTQRQFNGKVDQVRLFNYVRSPAQVAWDYNRGAPVSYWDFDECQGSVANDSSGNRNTGTITLATGNALGTCNTSSTFWGGSGGTGAGKINYSPTFDGTDDYINVGDPSSGIFDMGTNDLSVSFWLKTTDTAGYVISKAYNTPYWGLSISTNKIAPHLHNGTTSTSVKSVTSINDGNWHHIAATYKRSGNLTVFVDGKSENTVSISGDSAVDISNSNNFSLMANCNPGCADVGNFVSGQLDDVKIFNYALSSTQVKNLYNGGGAVRFGPVTGAP